jgi:hypothetical protein
VLLHTKQGAGDLKKTVVGFGHSLGGLNTLFNELAYKPKGKQSFLFYLPWINHDLNATYNLNEPAGPLQRALVMISCTGTSFAYGVAAEKPYYRMILNSIPLPRANQLPHVGPEPLTGIECGPEQ